MRQIPTPDVDGPSHGRCSRGVSPGQKTATVRRETARRGRRGALALLVVAMAAPGSAWGQRDTVDLVAGRPLRGTIESSQANLLVIESEDGRREVPGWLIRRVRFDDEPNELTRARTSFADDRYNATLEELDRMASPPQRPLVVADVDYLRAMATARTALGGGAVPLSQAIEALRQFAQTHPDHYLRETALEAWADLTFSQGEFTEAARMYEQLASGNWPEIAFQSRVQQAKALVLGQQYAAALPVLAAIDALEVAEEYQLQGKAIARCLRAQALAFTGDTAQAREIAEDVIRNSDPKNTALFGWAYNALGASYGQQQQWKEALRAYLHTDLLFTSDPDAHGQALYQLSQIWPRLDRQDRADEARQEIRERYRNSFWAQALDGN